MFVVYVGVNHPTITREVIYALYTHTYYAHGSKSFRYISLTINSSSSTLHLRYVWDPRTKVIACATCEVCAKEFVIERYYLFYIIVNMGFCFLAMTGQALLMSPKGRNASWDGLVKLWKEAFILGNTTVLLCEITTSFV